MLYRETSGHIFAVSEQAEWAYVSVNTGGSHNDVTILLASAQCWWSANVLKKRIENKDLIMK